MLYSDSSRQTSKFSLDSNLLRLCLEFRKNGHRITLFDLVTAGI